MYNLLKKLFVVIVLSVLTLLNAQTQRNPVLEYCTGTWCQWCPCGHTIISQDILPAIPNAIVLSYHGPANSTDPYSTFSGNTIISSLGFSAYPTGIIDRTSLPVSRSEWYSRMSTRLSIPATVDITIYKTFNSGTRQLFTTLYVTPLVLLSGQYKLNLVLIEDDLKYAQTGNASCSGGPDYTHNHVVRAMINGALGENLNTGQSWDAGVTVAKDISYTVPSNFSTTSSHLVAFVYKDNTPLNSGGIQQAKKWALEGNIIPVELITFNASIIENGIQLNWQTASELNNIGFEVQRSLDGNNFFDIGFVKGTGTTTENNNYFFIDTKLVEENLYYYRLKQIDFDGTLSFSDVISVLYNIPKTFSLEPNYPNPFNPTTKINWQSPVSGWQTLRVYDVLGREVATLVDEFKPAGSYEHDFDGSNLPSGIYLYRLTTRDFSQTRKMILEK